MTFAKEYTNTKSLLLIRQKDSDVPPSHHKMKNPMSDARQIIYQNKMHNYSSVQNYKPRGTHKSKFYTGRGTAGINVKFQTRWYCKYYCKSDYLGNELL